MLGTFSGICPGGIERSFQASVTLSPDWNSIDGTGRGLNPRNPQLEQTHR